jgi:hypothetical protein
METNKPQFSREVRFEMEKEVWNRYDLADNVELRIRAIIVKILMYRSTEDSSKINYTGEFTTITNIIPNEGFNLFGKPGNRSYTLDELNNAPTVEIEYKTINEDWNIYRLEDGTKLKTKLFVASVKRLSGLFDRYGVPLYNVNSSTVVNLDLFKKL